MVVPSAVPRCRFPGCRLLRGGTVGPWGQWMLSTSPGSMLKLPAPVLSCSWNTHLAVPSSLKQSQGAISSFLWACPVNQHTGNCDRCFHCSSCYHSCVGWRAIPNSLLHPSDCWRILKCCQQQMPVLKYLKVKRIIWDLEGKITFVSFREGFSWNFAIISITAVPLLHMQGWVSNPCFQHSQINSNHEGTG